VERITGTMSNGFRYSMTVEYVPDIEDAKRFYTDVLGLEIEREAPTFVQFRDGAGVNYAIANDEPLSDGQAREIYWATDDAERAHADLSRRGVAATPVRELPFGKVFSVTDPAGQPIFLIEFAQQRPSQAVP
jgi:catechol 2,3-dioxygenase-like lactoylglutathione lyase family enzyme